MSSTQTVINKTRTQGVILKAMSHVNVTNSNRYLQVTNSRSRLESKVSCKCHRLNELSKWGPRSESCIRWLIEFVTSIWLFHDQMWIMQWVMRMTTHWVRDQMWITQWVTWVMTYWVRDMYTTFIWTNVNHAMSHVSDDLLSWWHVDDFYMNKCE